MPLSPAFLAELQRIVGAGGLIQSVEGRLVYECDMHTFYKGAPDAVALPRRAEEVVEIVKLCVREKVAIVPFLETLNHDIRRTRNIAPGAACLLLAMTAVGFFQVKDMEHAYPDNRPVLDWLRPRVDAQTTILSEDPYLFRFAFFPTIPNSLMFEVTWFDNNLDGRAEAQDAKRTAAKPERSARR